MFKVTLGRDNRRGPYSVVVARFEAGDLSPSIPSGRTHLTGKLPSALLGTEFGRIVTRLALGGLVTFERTGETIKFFFRPGAGDKARGDLEFTCGVFAGRGHEVTLS